MALSEFERNLINLYTAASELVMEYKRVGAVRKETISSLEAHLAAMASGSSTEAVSADDVARWLELSDYFYQDDADGGVVLPDGEVLPACVYRNGDEQKHCQ